MTTESEAQLATETVRLHLHVLDQDHLLEVAVPTGPRRMVELLPAVRALSERLTALALDRARADGKAASCGPGCGACCRQLVAISLVEAQGVAEVVAALPPERQATIRARFADAVRRLEAAGLLDPTATRGARALEARNLGSVEASRQDVGRRYFAQRIACPFLEDESCSIYADRPLTCREYHVGSPAERCARLYEQPVDRIEGVRNVGDALMRAAHEVAGAPLGKIPLVLSLEWHDAAVARRATPGARLLDAGPEGLDQMKVVMERV